MTAKRPVVLIVRDGWGNAEPSATNAVHVAETPVDDRLRENYPNGLINSSGEDVGLPDGVMGNSEVGHQNLGAGRIVDQEVMRITRTIRDGSFFSNPVALGAFEHAQQTGGSVHIMGLVSDGCVHSDLQHAFALVDLCKQQEFPGDRFFVHALMDGRDTPPYSGVDYLRQFNDKLRDAGVGRIASVIGRFYAMDRDNRWERVERAYRALTRGGERTAQSPVEAAQTYYEEPTTQSQLGDEFIVPTSIVHPDTGEVEDRQKISAGDAVIFFNYRGDRPREITKAFVLSDEAWSDVQAGGFDRGEKLDNLYFAGMTLYESSLPIRVLFEKPPKMANIMGQWLSEQGLKQFRCAETEKYAHVTFFFNDYREEPFDGEDRLLVPSPQEVATYDEKPEMSAYEVTDAIVKRIAEGTDDFILINYANGDMVGHTGVLEAAVKACAAVDECVGRVVEAVQQQGGSLVITADHGNSEQMYNPETDGAFTAHTTSPVPLIVVDDRAKGQTLREGGCLADVVPTVLQLMGLSQPGEMTGRSLLPDPLN